MPRVLARRLARLEEATTRHFAYPPPSLLFIKEGEADADAIMRTCGPAGLPDRPPGAAPHIVFRFVKPAIEGGPIPSHFNAADPRFEH